MTGKKRSEVKAMKMEYVTNRALLAAYLAVEYKDKETLVIYLDSDRSQQEFDTLMKELDEMGYLPPRGWVLVSGYIVIEMPWGLACKVIAAHNKGTVRMETYQGGKLLSETM